MNNINLYIMDMSYVEKTSNVDKNIEMLISGLNEYRYIQVYWIHFRADNGILLYREEYIEHYTKITLPLPQFSTIVSRQYKLRKYNEHIYRITRHFFTSYEKSIIHLHTLDLIDLAVYIREQTGCKIITHLHCIPCKLQLYANSDALICASKCCLDYLNNTINKSKCSLNLIHYGIKNFDPNFKSKISKNNCTYFHCLFVADTSKENGIIYILNSLQLVQQRGYNIFLTIAGDYSVEFRNIIEKYTDIEIKILEKISLDELKKYYEESDIGLIGSLQGQASYVPVEMAMFGLPIVTTAVGDLDEIFIDELTALKVNVTSSKLFGFSIDIEKMANQIIRLISNEELRCKLSRNARELYETKMNLNTMLRKTIQVYDNVLHEKHIS